MEEKIISMLGEIGSRLDNIDKRLDKIDTRFDKMDKRLDKMDTRFDSIDKRLDKMDTGFDSMEAQVKENTGILRSLEHASEIHKSSIDNLTLAVSRVEGDVKGIREDLAAVELITSKNWNDIVKLKAVK